MTRRRSWKKIKNLFQDSFSIINDFIIPPLPQTKDLGSLLIAIEANRTWNELKTLVADYSESYATKDAFHKINEFLIKRWVRIAEIPALCYTHTYQYKLTQVCEKIAARLALSGSLVNRFHEPAHRLELLLPGVDFSNEILGTKSLREIDALFEDKKIKLSSFKLDYIRDLQANITSIKPLYILDCLDSGRSTRKLSNPNKAGNPLLEYRDVDRVKYHSKEAFAIYTHIQDYYAEKIASLTLGGYLYRLIESLRAGGVRKGGGKENAAGQKAYDGVKVFYEFCQTLSPQHYKKLLECESRDAEDYTFKYVWYKVLSGSMGYVDLLLTFDEMNEIAEYLAPFDLQKHKGSTTEQSECISNFCVEVYAQTFERILHHNDHLYTIRAMDDSIECETINYKLEAECKLDAAEVNFLLATANENIPGKKGFTHYTINEISRFDKNVRDALGFGDTSYVRTLCENLVTCHESFFNLLSEVKSSLHSALLKHIPTADIQTMLLTADDLTAGFAKLSSMTDIKNTHIAILNILGGVHLGKIFDSINELYAFGKIVDAQVFTHFKKLLSPLNLMVLQGDESYMRGFIDTLPVEEQGIAQAVLGVSLNPLPASVSGYYSVPLTFSFFSPYYVDNRRFSPKLTHRLEATESESNKRVRSLPTLPLIDESIDEENAALSRLIYSRR